MLLLVHHADVLEVLAEVKFVMAWASHFMLSSLIVLAVAATERVKMSKCTVVL